MNKKALPGTINGDPVDRFTLVHGAVGAALGHFTPLPFGAVACIAIGWEFLERPLKDTYPDLFPHSSQDTLANATLDACAVLAGWWLARRFK